MSGQHIKVSNPVLQKCRTLGETGLEWLAALGNLIEELERDWQITVGASLEGGSAGYVAQARTKEGTDVILKIAMPEMDGNGVFACEVLTLQMADGRGYVRLLAHDFNRRAMLQERLGISLAELGLPTKDQIEIICSTLKKAWVPVPPASPIQSGAQTAEDLSKFITELWEDLNRPCSKSSFDLALSFAQSRKAAFDPKTSVLVHGDAHSGNTLLDAYGKMDSLPQCKFIDPDGLIAEPAYDLGILMREWMEELTEDPVGKALERCAYLHFLTGVDRQAIWEWGFIQCMSTGLFLIRLGEEQSGIQMLKVAEEWSEASHAIRAENKAAKSWQNRKSSSE